jgi:hypothetical protein
MHYDAPRQISLVTIPPEDPHIWEEARFRGKDDRPITHWGMERIPTPMAVPGKYEARLTVDGKTLTEPITILMDPNSPGSEADIDSSVKLQLEIASEIDRISDMANNIEWMRKQLADIEKMPGANPADKERQQQAAKMDEKMQVVEYELFSKPLAASDDKTYISAWKVYYNLMWLNGEIGSGAGDVAGGTDFKPTDTEVQLAHEDEQDLVKAEGDYHNLMTKDLPAFNHTLLEHNAIPVAATGAPAADSPADSPE